MTSANAMQTKEKTNTQIKTLTAQQSIKTIFLVIPMLINFCNANYSFSQQLL